MTNNRLRNSYQDENKTPDLNNNEDEQPILHTRIPIKNLHHFVGFAVIILALMVGFSLISYIFTGRADQSVVEGLSIFDLVGSGRESNNWLKLFGAYTSHILIYSLFGVASFAIAPFIFLTGLDIMRKRIFRYQLFYQLIAFLFWFSLFCGYIILTFESNAAWGFFCGGIGYELAFWFESFFGIATIFVLIASALFFVSYFGYYDLNKVIKNTPYKTDESKTQKEVIFDEDKNEKTPENKIQNRFEDEIVVEKVENKNESEVKNYVEKTPLKQISKPKIVKTKTEINEENEVKTAEPEILATTQEESPEEIVISEKTTLEEENEILEEKKNEPKISNTISLDDEDDGNFLIAEEFDIEEKRQTKIITAEVPVPKFNLGIQYIDPVHALDAYQMPPFALMDDIKSTRPIDSEQEIYDNMLKITNTLEAFKITITNDVRAEVGPTVTLYEIVPAPGIKISQIRKVADDIALSLSAIGIRIIAPMPGRGTIGIEVPNKNREKVTFRALLESDSFINTQKELPIVLGKTISNDVFITDLAKMPHLLIGGATGQGKSVGINVILTSLLYKKHPGELKFVLIDPKKVEFSIYDKLNRHYLAQMPDAKSPVVTDANEALRVLESLCLEMDNRYELLKNSECRQLIEYNLKFKNKELNLEAGNRFLPYIVVIIDELADLMITTAKSIERPIARLAQMARAVGIHLVVATQRPSVNVITGVIKANFPARMAFKVSSKMDSRVVIDVDGAEQLLGMGDMLLTNGSDIIRLQCAFIDTVEVERITNFIGSQKGYDEPYILPDVEDPNKQKAPQYNLHFDGRK